MIDPRILNSLLDQLQFAAGVWAFNLHPIALRLFGLLSSLELVYSSTYQVLEMFSAERGVGHLLGFLLKKVLYLGFAYYLVMNAGTLLPQVILGFQYAGSAATGLPGLSPSGFLETGASVTVRFVQAFNETGLLHDPFATLCVAIGAWISTLAFAAMAGIVLLTLVESYVALAGVSFLLATAASRWTAPIAEGILAYVLRVGVRLFVLYLLAGVVQSATLEWARLLGGGLFSGPTPLELLTFTGSAVTVVLLLWSAPRMAASIVPPGTSFRLNPAQVD
jgi:type IV secretion system protein TrbL